MLILDRLHFFKISNRVIPFKYYYRKSLILAIIFFTGVQRALEALVEKHCQP